MKSQEFGISGKQHNEENGSQVNSFNVEQKESNGDWQRKSRAIALAILTRMEELEINKRHLAERMDVTPIMVGKWLKGKHNFTLEVLAQLETSLGVELISVNFPELGEGGEE